MCCRGLCFPEEAAGCATIATRTTEENRLHYGIETRECSRPWVALGSSTHHAIHHVIPPLSTDPAPGMALSNILRALPSVNATGPARQAPVGRCSV